MTIGENRLELLMVEVQEERVRLLRATEPGRQSLACGQDDSTPQFSIQLTINWCDVPPVPSFPLALQHAGQRWLHEIPDKGTPPVDKDRPIA